MRNTQSTYEKHVSELRAYGMIPMDYDTWKMWNDYDEGRIKLCRRQDNAGN